MSITSSSVGNWSTPTPTEAVAMAEKSNICSVLALNCPEENQSNMQTKIVWFELIITFGKQKTSVRDRRTLDCFLSS